ncbi:MAG: DeoR family transcriptional regulator [Treponema sp.]|nr:DeoR family transcriptional regulator [Treponema sp.]
MNDDFSWNAQNQNIPVNDRQREILEYLQNGKSLTVVQFAQKFNVADKTIKRDLQYLCENELIRRVGSDKSGKWEIIQK